MSTKKIFLLTILLITSWLILRNIFISDENLILHTLKKVSGLVSFDHQMHPFEHLKRVRDTADFFTQEISLVLRSKDGSQETKTIIKDTLTKHLTLTKSKLNQLSVSFTDEKVKLKDNKAEVTLVALIEYKKNSGSKTERYAHRVKVKLQKISSEWLIIGAEDLEEASDTADKIKKLDTSKRIN